MSTPTANALVRLTLQDGGCTVNRGGVPVDTSTGYVVGGVVPTLVTDDFWKLVYWVDANPADYYGGWLDSETELAHYDVVSFVADLHDAIKLGTDRGEIAIWDCAANDEIRLADAGWILVEV